MKDVKRKGNVLTPQAPDIVGFFSAYESSFTNAVVVTSHTSEVSSQRPYLTEAKPNQFGPESVRYRSIDLCSTLANFLLRDIDQNKYLPPLPVSWSRLL